MRQYRSGGGNSYNTSYSSYSGNSSRNNLWKYGVFAGVLVLGVWWLYGSQDASNPSGNTGIIVSMGSSGGEVALTDAKGKTSPLTTTSPLEENMKVAVKKGEGIVSATNKSFTLTLGTNAEMKYNGNVSSGSINLLSGKGWLESRGTTAITLKNISVKARTGSTLMFSQNAIASNVYVLLGSAMVKVNDSSTTLVAGKSLTILNGDVGNASLSVVDKVQPIDDTTRQDSFFTKHKGNIVIPDGETGTGGTLLASGATGQLSRNSGSLLKMGGGHIEITTPRDEETMSALKFEIAGKILDPLVTRVTINDREASVSPVEKTFTYKDFTASADVSNITYKAYDAQKNLLEKGVLTVYVDRSKLAQTTRPSVTTYPVSDKNFRIVAPTENPYKTTEDIIQIQGTVPGNLVKNISVNGFQLTKFKPYSTTWYYFANKDYKTLAEGINEYTIQYFDADGKILSTGKFIIVKESKQQPNSEENTPLFP